MPVPVKRKSRVVELPLPGLVCLGLIEGGADHGWAVGTLLAPDGEIGRIWTLSRPLTYRAIDQLVERKYVTRRGAARSRGGERSVLRVTAAGRRTLDAWLDRPVDHLRDVRTELLVKLELRRRLDRPVEPLVTAQQRHFAEAIESLAQGGGSGDPVDLWRSEHARAVRRFLARVLEPTPHPAIEAVRTKMRLSARNQLAAVVTDVLRGDVMASVLLVLPDGQHVSSTITNAAVNDLDLAPGDSVVVIIKSTEVMIAKPIE